MFEAGFSDPLLETVVVPHGRDLDDHVDVVGWPELRCRLIGYPQLDSCTADEDDLLD